MNETSFLEIVDILQFAILNNYKQFYQKYKLIMPAENENLMTQFLLCVFFNKVFF